VRIFEVEAVLLDGARDGPASKLDDVQLGGAGQQQLQFGFHGRWVKTQTAG
jgi:hypothetical protein